MLIYYSGVYILEYGIITVAELVVGGVNKNIQIVFKNCN